MRAFRLAIAVVVATIAGLLATGGPAGAHPMGNFSVNQYQGLTLSPDRIRVVVVVSTAELPTVQERADVDANRDGRVGDDERSAYAAKACQEAGRGLHVDVAGRRLRWTVTPGGFEYLAGENGLPTGRLTCSLVAPADLATGQITVTVVNTYRPDRVGWHELTATGDGVRLIGSPLPESSVSDELRAFPAALDSPSALLNVRTAEFRVAPGVGPGSGGGNLSTSAAGTTESATSWADRNFQRLAAGRMTPWLAVAAVLIALLLGAGHAMLPGHGKTVLGMYLAGRPRDAVVVGATVTATHTGAVLVVGLLISAGTALAGERLLGYLGIVSALAVVVIGVAMLAGVLRRRDAARRHHHDHTHHDHAHHDHDHDHHHHDHHRGPGRIGLTGIGLAGGLVPSPSALVVLLAAIGMGRAAFGVLLVFVYGLGMAATLVAAGMLLVALRPRLAALVGRLGRLSTRLSAATPALTAVLVILMGIGMGVRAAAILV